MGQESRDDARASGPAIAAALTSNTNIGSECKPATRKGEWQRHLGLSARCRRASNGIGVDTEFTQPGGHSFDAFLDSVGTFVFGPGPFRGSIGTRFFGFSASCGFARAIGFGLGSPTIRVYLRFHSRVVMNRPPSGPNIFRLSGPSPGSKRVPTRGLTKPETFSTFSSRFPDLSLFRSDQCRDRRCNTLGPRIARRT